MFKFGRNIIIIVAVMTAMPRHALSRYAHVQPLGFSINTGPAALCVDNNCSTALDTSNCPNSGTVNLTVVDLYNATVSFNLCVDQLNPDCGCSTDGCEAGLGFKRDVNHNIVGAGRTHDDGDLLELEDVSCYVSFPSVEDDVRGRVQIMTTAIEKAYDLADKDDRTLKIFNAPEFFFRGRDGSYVFDEKTWETSAVFAIGEALAKYVLDKKFQDFLFVFGTIIATNADAKMENPDDGLAQYVNFALVIKGGPDGDRFVVPKLEISWIDFLYGNDREKNPYFYDEDSTWDYSNSIFVKFQKKLERDYKFQVVENNWIKIDGIVVSIEICLDHYLGAAIGNSAPMTPVGKEIRYGTNPQFLAQISIITSAGMVVETKNLVLTPGGTIFLQDGLGDAITQDLTCEPINNPFTENETPVKWNPECTNPDPDDPSTDPILVVELYDSYDSARNALRGRFALIGAYITTPKIKVYAPKPIVALRSATTPPPPPPTAPPSHHRSSKASKKTASNKG